LFIEVNKIPPEGLEVDRLLSLPPILQSNGEQATLEAARLEGIFRRTRSDVEFRGRVEAVVSLVCSRCLDPFKMKVEGACHRIFRSGPPPRLESEHELAEEDLALTPFEGSRISLEEIAQEQVYLVVPLKPLCSDSCRGICPRCGAERNTVACGCPEEPPESVPLTSKLIL